MCTKFKITVRYLNVLFIVFNINKCFDTFQIEINYRVAFRRSAGSHMCDENTIDNGTINSGEGTLKCLKGCSGSITTMSYYCTDFSDIEEWTTGTNSIKYNPSTSSDNLYHFG